MDFNTDVVNQWYEAPEFPVTAEQTKAYAAATSERAPALLSGMIAPPLFAVVPARSAVRPVFKRATPLYLQLKALHGEQDIYFHRPIRSGMTLRPRAAVTGIHRRSTGVTLVARVENYDETGTLINELYYTLFFRGATLEEDVGRPAPEHRIPAEVREEEPLARVRVQTERDQPARYAAASGDTGAYHLDEAAALAAGLPGIIMHGLCTMALVGQAVIDTVCEGDPLRLKRLAVRFTRPVFPGETLLASIWQHPDPHQANAYLFDTKNSGDKTVLDHGRAEIAT